MVLQVPAAIRVEIFPLKGAWRFNLRWKRDKEDIGQFWSKIQNKIAKQLPTNGPEKSEVVFTSVDSTIRVEDEDDLLDFIENAADDGEDRIQLRAMDVEVQIDQFHCLSSQFSKSPTITSLLEYCKYIANYECAIMCLLKY